MRTVRTKVYKFNELSEDAKQKAICNQIEFEISMIEDEHNAFWDAAQEMEKMQTPWFLGERIYHDKKLKQIIVNDILAMNLDYTKDGKIFHQ